MSILGGGRYGRPILSSGRGIKSGKGGIVTNSNGMFIRRARRRSSGGGVGYTFPGIAALSPTLWLDATDISTIWQDDGSTQVSADGQDVQRWDNKGSAGGDLTNGTSGDLLYKTNLYNSQPAVRQTAAALGLSSAGSFNNTDIWTTSQSHTMWFVYKLLASPTNDDATNARTSVDMLINNLSNRRHNLGFHATNNSIITNGFTGSGWANATLSTAAGGGWSTSAVQVLEVDYQHGVGTYMRVDEQTQVGATDADNKVFETSGTSDVVVGNHTTADGGTVNFDLCEVVVVDGTVSAADKDGCFAFLKGKWQ